MPVNYFFNYWHILLLLNYDMWICQKHYSIQFTSTDKWNLQIISNETIFFPIRTLKMCNLTCSIVWNVYLFEFVVIFVFGRNFCVLVQMVTIHSYRKLNFCPTCLTIPILQNVHQTASDRNSRYQRLIKNTHWESENGDGSKNGHSILDIEQFKCDTNLFA